MADDSERLRRHIAELELALEQERERNLSLQKMLETERRNAVDQQFEMAENSLRLLELKESLEAEQVKSARLLRNILPERVIVELQGCGRSRPELFEHVTVFFSDIVDFTRRSAGLEPEEVIAELSDLFSGFDRIFIANGCERIKTSGDAYLSVSGLPVSTPNHCANILKAACEALHFLQERNRTSRHQWEMRFGIHSGRVVGGIVGTEKYIYDIFGDTVNTAARMEQLSKPMMINVSEIVHDEAPASYRFIERPVREVKGKGAMKMFFIDLPSPGAQTV